MTEHEDEQRALDRWSHRLTNALNILDLEPENDLILDVAAQSARSVGPSAAAVSAFYVGYAAALAASSGHVDPQAAVHTAAQKVLEMSRDGNAAGPASGGWTETAQ